MSKKKIIFLFSIFLIIIGITSSTLNAKATNPEHLDLLLDDDTGYMSIYVVHGVTNEDEHYVDSLLITVNGTTVVDRTFTSQETYNILHFEHTFDPIPVDGDIIYVKVTCNFGGEFDEELILGYKRPGHEEEFSSVIPPVVVSTIIVIIILLLPKILIKDKEIIKHQ